MPRNKPMLFDHMREIDRKMSEIEDAESRRMFEGCLAASWSGFAGLAT